MSHQSDEEERLQRLFDATAGAPEGERLDRLARFAAQVPARHVPVWKRWLRRTPALALAFAGVTVLALWMGRTRPLAVELGLPHPSANVVEEPVAEEDDPFALEVPEDDEFMIDDPLAALDDNGGESPLALLDLLAIPEDDAALDTWSEAMKP
jgi:hypothetical protein